MLSLPAPLPSGRKVVLVDALAGVWVLAWLLVASLVATAVGELTALSDALSIGGRAVESSGRTIGTLSSLPIVGNEVARAAREAQEAGLG